MHNGEEMTVDRKTGVPPTIHVQTAAVCITGGVQPAILAGALGQEHHESGMLARLLFAMPPRKRKQWTEAEVSVVAEAAVAELFDRLFALTMAPDPKSTDPLNPDLIPRLLALTERGKRAWVMFYNEHAGEQADLTGDEAAAWSKLEGGAARFALVIHLVRWAAGDTTLRDPDRVDEASIAAGVSLARWFGEEARRVYAILSESDEDKELRRLVEWIERKGGSATARDLTHGLRAYRGDSALAEKALGELVKAGIAEWFHDPSGEKGGRPTSRVRLVRRGVTTVTVTETPANSGNDVGYGDGDTGDGSTTPGTGDGWGEL